MLKFIRGRKTFLSYSGLISELGGSNVPNEGFILIKGSNGTWGGICDDFWDYPDADVVCRMLGYPSSETIYTQSSPFGHGPVPRSFVLDDVECVGNETSVFDCPHKTEFDHNCYAGEWAGVKCKISNSQLFYKLKKDSLLQNAFVSEDKQIIQKPVGFGEITEENHEKSDWVSKEGKIQKSVLMVNFPSLDNL